MHEADPPGELVRRQFVEQRRNPFVRVESVARREQVADVETQPEAIVVGILEQSRGLRDR